ncbi:MAG TPA: ABC transporter substrate-binding protein [Chondromyces sp.]|nr:ABC transporter substrate-binding protein [Chondromyces sp.]
MGKLATSLLSAVMAAGLLAGCGGNNSTEQGNEGKKEEKTETAQAAFPVTIKDATGKDVTIEEQPDRIVSLIPSNTEIAFELGLENEIVGVTDFDNYPKEATEKEKIGGLDFNVEKVVSLEPDLVLAHGSNVNSSKEGFEQLEAAGIDVLVINEAQNFEEVYDSIEMIGEATGKTAEAGEVVEEMKSDLEEIEKKAEGITEEEQKRVFIEVSPAPEIYTTGKNTFMQEMLDIIHAENVAADQEGWIQMTEEAIIQKDPEVILVTHGFYTEQPVEQIMGRKGWEDITAVKEKQVHDVNADLVNRSGPRLVEGVEELAKAIYPDVFAQ